MNEFVEPFERLLADASTPQVVRAIEAGQTATPLWNAIEASGFLDAMIPEAHGGYGMPLSEVFGLSATEGRYATPLPVGQTLLARAVIATAGAQVPAGPIAIATSAQEEPGGRIVCRHTPYALVAEWVVASLPGRWLLLPKAQAVVTPSGIHGSLHADLEWQSPSAASHASSTAAPWREAGAVLAAAQMAGAMERVLEMTLQFANDRVQFGRSIGKFQAIQHQLAVMAENVAAARMAAQIGFDAQGPFPHPLRAAAAKARASEAAALVAPMAHAIHGAIGVTAELDLQLFTRRLHDWRADFGSERAWNTVLGRALLATGDATLDFMRAQLLPTS
jgi:alkylation response protein AidB-like acyl-CoA dehydrogenase